MSINIPTEQQHPLRLEDDRNKTEHLHQTWIPKIVDRLIKRNTEKKTLRELTLSRLLADANAWYPQSIIGDYTHDPAGIKSVYLLLINDPDFKQHLFSYLEKFEPNIELLKKLANNIHRAFGIPVEFVKDDDKRLDEHKRATVIDPQTNKLKKLRSEKALLTVFLGKATEHGLTYYAKRALIYRFQAVVKEMFHEQVIDTETFQKASKLPESPKKIEAFLRSHNAVKERLTQRLNDELDLLAPYAEQRRKLYLRYQEKSPQEKEEIKKELAGIGGDAREAQMAFIHHDQAIASLVQSHSPTS